MIPEKTAKQQIKRILAATLSYPPDDTTVLTQTLARRAESEAHARLVIDAVLEKFREWPKPADIVDLCSEIIDPDSAFAKQQRDSTRAACEYCDGTGWRVVHGEYGTSAAFPCTHKPLTEAEGRMGVRFAPSVARQYAEQTRGAEERRIPYRPR